MAHNAEPVHGTDITAAQEMMTAVDVGARRPGRLPAAILTAVALAWAIMQLWYASPLPFIFHVLILNDTQARSIHLAFALFLAFTAYPAFSRSPRDRIPLHDWLMAAVGAFCGAYLFLFYEAIAERPGLPTTLDLVAAVVGLVLLIEAARRALGPALSIIAIIFLIYIFAGPYLPDIMAHRGASLSRAMTHMWLTTEGVYGVALGVSTNFVFLFVLFGALLEQAGAGNYFIKLSFALLGHMRGGPAKAAVVSSGMTGLISGSSIANVVTTGTFTIPLMKRVGYPAAKAGAVEVSASVNGQIMPPVMGAAAFLIAEYVGISYIEVVKHAFLPAIITYLALFYVVHLEAVRANLEGLVRRQTRPLLMRLISLLTSVLGIIILSGVVYYGIGWIKDVFGSASGWVSSGLLAVVYVGLIGYAARSPDLEVDDPNKPVLELPDFASTVKTGLHFLLPVIVLVWCLMIERLSPGLSAFYATAVMMVILVTQRPLLAWFRGQPALGAPLRRGLRDLRQGMVTGSRNMVGIGIATAAAGIVVGTVTLTGLGLVMTELVDFLSGGILMVMLLLTAVICLILGMGLPTTANYIVVATLMAPVIVELGAQNGLAVPLIAVHLFVFYFGLMADVTPPVGLASFAASAISGADPLKTGVQAFKFEMRTALLPFIFIFNNQLLLIGVDSWWYLLLTVASAVLAMMMFVAATQGYFLARSRWYESVALALICFTLFRPGFWMDMLYPPFAEVPAARIEQVAAAQPADGFLRFRAKGDTLAGDTVEKVMKLRLGTGDTGKQRLAAAGLTLSHESDGVYVGQIRFGSAAAKLGLDFGWQILGVQVPADRPAKEWMFVPALLLLGFVVLLQRGRRRRSAERAASPQPV